MKNNLYKISEIADFFDTTTTTIRYYEEFGLLKPEYVDSQTKYRYYDVANINTVAYILELRGNGMSISDIKRYMSGEYSVERHIAELKRKRFLLDKLISANEALCAKKNIYDVNYICLPATAYVKQDVLAPTLEDLYSMFFDFLQNAVREITIGDSVITYIEFDTTIPVFENIRATIGCDIKNSKKDIGIVRPQISGIRTFHKGSYETIYLAYDALRDFATKNNIELKGNAFEYYYESFNIKKTPKEYLTEIIFPIK